MAQHAQNPEHSKHPHDESWEDGGFLPIAIRAIRSHQLSRSQLASGKAGRTLELINQVLGDEERERIAPLPPLEPPQPETNGASEDEPFDPQPPQRLGRSALRVLILPLEAKDEPTESAAA